MSTSKRIEARRSKILDIVKNLRLIDDDFLTKVFEDKDCVALLLSIILEKNFEIIEVKTQYNIKNLQGKSIRLDIFATDETGKKYNIEIQRNNKGAIEKRARYNSSLIDANIFDIGENYKNLPESYVIFITEKDVIGNGLPIYHIESTISETNKIFNDGRHIVYVNSEIKDDTKLGKLMQDFYCTDYKNMNYDILANRVYYFKEEQEGVNFMCSAIELLYDEAIEEGKMEGKIEGKIEGVKLTKSIFKLFSSGKTEFEIAKELNISIEEVKEILS